MQAWLACSWTSGETVRMLGSCGGWGGGLDSDSECTGSPGRIVGREVAGAAQVMPWHLGAFWVRVERVPIREGWREVLAGHSGLAAGLRAEAPGS